MRGDFFSPGMLLIMFRRQRDIHGDQQGKYKRLQDDPPVLEVAEAVLDWGAGGGQGLVSLSLGGGGLAGPGGFVSGDDDRVVRVGVQAGEPEVGQGAEPGGAQPVRRGGRGGRR